MGVSRNKGSKVDLVMTYDDGDGDDDGHDRDHDDDNDTMSLLRVWAIGVSKVTVEALRINIFGIVQEPPSAC